MKHLFLPFLLLISFFSAAQTQGWKKISLSKANTLNKGVDVFKNNYKPAKYSIYSLDETSIRSKLSLLRNGSFTKVTVSFPVGDELLDFEVQEHAMMEPGLQAKYNNIRSYTGICKQKPGYTVRFDINPGGIHASIKRPGETIQYINSISAQSGLYVIFDRKDAGRNEEPFHCATEALLQTEVAGKAAETLSNANDGKIRQFRLAFSTGGEFSRLLLNGTETNDDDKKASVMAGLTTMLTRCNEVYESDFGIHLVFPENMDTLIFLNSGTDPYTSSIIGFFFIWGTQGQRTMDSRLGQGGYDVGHTLMGIPTGGNAGCIGCVCNNGSKGLGATGFVDNLTSDPFIIDYLSHEVGHQFGANHTFTYSNENSQAQIEPGSGSTIMGYAGTTGVNDVQQNSDPYFSTASVKQVLNNISAGTSSACAVLNNANNIAPVVNAGSDIFIPKSTPFKLVGSATDADAGDNLTYGWEQNDVFVKGSSSSLPLPSSTAGPQFRSVLPSLQNVRYFPSFNTLLQGTLYNTWEVLPDVGREMNFKLTVRDNRAAAGQNSSDDVKVTVADNAGPFQIDQPVSVNWKEGETQLITWQVNNTDQAPINAESVNIFLSIDNGTSFPYLLAGSVPNDGSELVTIPLIPFSTTTGRVLIEPVNNSFFTLSPQAITIDGTLPVSWLSFTAKPSGKNNAWLQWQTASEINNNRFEVERSADGIHFIKVATVAAGNNGNTTQAYQFTDLNIPAGKNFYRIRQVDKDGKYSFSSVAFVTVSANGYSWILLPNPATDFTMVQFYNTASRVELSIADANGRVLSAYTIPSVQNGLTERINLGGFAKGIYFVSIKMNGLTEHQKLIIQ